MIRILMVVAAVVAGVPSWAQTEAITPIADVVRGGEVTLHGTVQRIVDEDEFMLADTSGSIEVYLGPNRVPVLVGEDISVRGYVDDDAGPPELCASMIRRADGTAIPISNCDG